MAAMSCTARLIVVIDGWIMDGSCDADTPTTRRSPGTQTQCRRVFSTFCDKVNIEILKSAVNAVAYTQPCCSSSFENLYFTRMNISGSKTNRDNKLTNLTNLTININSQHIQHERVTVNVFDKQIGA